jgi:hypothetical protein
MQYLLLCCFDEERWRALPQSQRDAVMRDYGELIRSLEASGNYRAGSRLEPSARAVTIRGRNDKPTVVDGPFAETKEQLGGYHLIECRDRDEALAIAQRIPTIRVGGSVEVRALDPVA